ncbi:MAG: hypothetical protein K2K25_07150 [Muribaculaceae bacterium]|nr:hypothetical protein [Muribaculaceae bacterium]
MKKMFRKLILLGTLLSAATNAMAESNTITFTYANDDLQPWGRAKSQIYDIAIRIDEPALVGKKITGIRALINAYEGVESTSLWLSKELTLEKIDGVKVTVPDSYSATVNPTKISISGDDNYIGELSVALDKPYEITEEGIYVGYSLTVPTVEKGTSLSEQQQYPILVTPSDNPKSLYLRASKDFLKWIAYNEKLGKAAAIYVDLEGDFSEYSVGLRELESMYVPVDKEFCLKAEISNPGMKDAESIDYTYTINGKTYERTMEFAKPILAGGVNTTAVELPIDPLSEIGTFTIDVDIVKVNGAENQNPKRMASATLNVIPYVPVHRPMVEEFTGTWCGWCIRGYYAMEWLNEDFGDNVVLAAYHDGDPMQADAFPLDPSRIGYPGAVLNRGAVEDPYYGTGEDGFGMKAEVAKSMSTIVPADIQVAATWTDSSKTKISVKSTSTFFNEQSNAGYKVGYLLLNNGLTGNGQSWIQHNYFPKYAAKYAGTEFEFLTKMKELIFGLTFNDVVVDASGVKGEEGSIPSDVVFNKPYQNDFTFDIEGNTVIQDKDKLYVAAFIINPNGTILNSNKMHVEYGTSVESIASGAREVSAEYYNISGVRVANPENGIYVKVSQMSDGTIQTKKIIK